VEHSQEQDEGKEEKTKTEKRLVILMKIDFHVHSHHSRCSNLDPKDAMRIAKDKGFDAIALISHNIKPIKYKSKGLKIIQGVEVSAKQGHMLVLNTNKEFKKGSDAQEIINQAGKNALIIIAHPFDPTRGGMGNHILKLKGYHAIELNGRCLFDKFNDKVREFARKNNIPLVAGSDSHFTEEMGNAHTIIKAKTIKEVIRKVKQGKTRCYIKKRPIIKKLKPYIKSMLRW